MSCTWSSRCGVSDGITNAARELCGGETGAVRPAIRWLLAYMSNAGPPEKSHRSTFPCCWAAPPTDKRARAQSSGEVIVGVSGAAVCGIRSDSGFLRLGWALQILMAQDWQPESSVECTHQAGLTSVFTQRTRRTAATLPSFWPSSLCRGPEGRSAHNVAAWVVPRFQELKG